jgi:hypothetical protein
MKQTNVTWINIYWSTFFLALQHLNQINTIKLSLLYINSYKHIHNMCVKKPIGINEWNIKKIFKYTNQIPYNQNLTLHSFKTIGIIPNLKSSMSKFWSNDHNCLNWINVSNDCGQSWSI